MTSMVLFTSMLTISCDELFDEDKNTGGDLETETVQNPTRIQHYEGSTQFANDIEALIDYSCAVYAMRVAYYNIASNDFKTGEAFVATPEDINVNTTSMYTFYDIAATIVEKADEYENAFNRMDQEDVLEKANASRETRGFLSDTFSFIFGLKKSQEVGRKSVLAVISKSGWQNNDRRLQELFNQVDPKRRQGYTNARQFWADFSQGKLDAKSNQIFQDLYHGDAGNFGLNARDLGFSPTGNMTKTAAQLIEKGLSVVIDAAPGGMAGAMTMGKDLYNTYEATEDVVKHTFKGTLTKEEGERLIKQWASNLINYNDKILNNMNNGSWDATIDMWDTPGNFLGQEFANELLNDATGFSEDVFRMSFGTLLDDEAITVKDKNGNPIDVVIVQDEDGKVRVSVKRSDDGSHKVKAKKNKKKKVTAVDKKGNRRTKDVRAGEKEVEVDMSKAEENDEPKDGYINFSPPSFSFAPEGGTQRIKLTTNYLYYGVTTSVDDGYWLEASPVQGTDEFIITAKPNNSGEDRTGKVIVKATNKKGKVLKWITITASQKKIEGGIVVKATPAVLDFGAEGGTQNSTVTCEGFEYWGGYVDEGTDWLTIRLNNNLTISVTAAANATGQTRSGKVVVYGSHVESPTTYDQITPATIVVNQAAAPASSVGSIIRVQITPDCYMYYDEQWQDMLSDIWQDWASYDVLCKVEEGDIIEAVEKNGIIHVNGQQSTIMGSSVKTASFSFDITNVSEDFKNSKVNNLYAHVEIIDSDGSKMTHTYTASNIPKIRYTYDKELEFSGTVASGITDFSYREEYFAKREPREDPRNGMNVIVKFAK